MEFSLAPLRDVLINKGYSRSHLHSLGAFRGIPVDRPQAIAATADGSPLSALVRLFFLRIPISGEHAAAALSPLSLDALLKHGLLARADANTIVSQAAIIPIGGLFTLRDFEPCETGQPLAADHVLGVGSATSILSTLTVRRPIARMLDLGTGQGFHALVGASHAQTVIATDINPRALMFARWAIELNGISHIDVRTGSLFEPVRDEPAFDLIVSNPPFIISPPHDLVCLGGFAQGDELVQSIVRAAPAHLNDGGFACIMCNWYHGDGAQPSSYLSRPREWIASSGCDAWLIELRRESAEEYVSQWIAETGHDGRAMLDEGAWRAYLDSIGAAFISLGIIILRKSPGPNWFRAEQLTMSDCIGEAGGQIERIFNNQRLIAQHPNAWELSKLPLGLVDTHELIQSRRASGGGGWKTTQSVLKHTEGFTFDVTLDEFAAELLGFFDGHTPAAEIISVMARRHKVDPVHAVRQSGGFLSKLLSLGYLVSGGTPASR